MTKEAQIRTFGKAEDDKLIRFMSGKARMELLAAANIRGTFKFSLSAQSLQDSFRMYGLPSPCRLGCPCCIIDPFSALVPSHWRSLQLCASSRCAVHCRPTRSLLDGLVCDSPYKIYPLIIFLRINRPYFEAYTQKSLAKPDIADPKTYYGRSPASGFWILEFGDSFVGLIALDASIDGASDDISFTVLPSKGTSRVAQIRHIYVVEAYRPARAEIDLLEHAINHAFKTNRDVQVIKHTTSDLNSYVGKALVQCGFVAVKSGSPMGVFGWKTTCYELTRESWEARTSS